MVCNGGILVRGEWGIRVVMGAWIGAIVGFVRGGGWGRVGEQELGLRFPGSMVHVSVCQLGVGLFSCVCVLLGVEMSVDIVKFFSVEVDWGLLWMSISRE